MLGIRSQRQKPAHSRSIVETVRTPERRKLIAEPFLLALSQSVRPVTCRANLRIDLRAATGISWPCRLLDLQRARAEKLGPIGNARGEPPHIGGKRSHFAALKR